MGAIALLMKENTNLNHVKHLQTEVIGLAYYGM